MKTCPYCKEQIVEDALKCRHCQSPLFVTPTEMTKDDRTVTYVLDKGLVQFGKFAVATMGIFAIMGTYVFGVDIKDTLKEMRAAEKEIRAAEEKIRHQELKIRDQVERQIKAMQEAESINAKLSQAKDSLEKTKLEIEKGRSRIEELVISSAEMASKSRIQLIEVEKIYAQLKYIHTQAKATQSNNVTAALTQEQQRLLEVIRNEQPLKFREVHRNNTTGQEMKLWASGTTLRIRFLDGERELQEKIASIAKEWELYANIKFQFWSDAEDAEVRISFSPGQLWAYVGATSSIVPRTQPTMNLGTDQLAPENEARLRHCVLRHFGHVLGLINEHNNPNAPDLLDEEEFAKNHKIFPDEYSRKSYFAKAPFPSYRPFDPDSVMLPAFSEVVTKTHRPMGGAHTLSQKDKEFIASLYPRT